MSNESYRDIVTFNPACIGFHVFLNVQSNFCAKMYSPECQSRFEAKHGKLWRSPQSQVRSLASPRVAFATRDPCRHVFELLLLKLSRFEQRLFCADLGTSCHDQLGRVVCKIPIEISTKAILTPDLSAHGDMRIDVRIPPIECQSDIRK